MQHELHDPDSPHNGGITNNWIAQSFARDLWIEQLLKVSAAELSGAAKTAATCIAMHIDDTGRCRLPVETIAEFAGMDSRSVRRMIHHLEGAGWLSVKRSAGHHPNSFRLTTPHGTVVPSTIGGRANG